MILTNEILFYFFGHLPVTSKALGSDASGAAVYFSVAFVQQPTEVIISCLESGVGICKQIVVCFTRVIQRW
jgi:hypothetical protein